MKTVAVATLAAILMSGTAMAAPSYPSYKGPSLVKSFRAPVLTPYERFQIRQSQHRLDMLKWRARADGRVTFLERWQIQLAQNRHNALVYRLTHN
ncbi:MAG TPA: hypothetical protein VNK52_10160 [Hyphomicrobiaceae bacterium]|nr:hypothetical protein [Hyphomicrobiaceae bacterium]